MAVVKKSNNVEPVEFDIPREQADRLRRLEGKEPAEIARNHLVGYYEDKRRTDIELVNTSLGWLPEVYQALVKHVGRGGVSHFIRESFYRYMIHRKFKLTPIPLLHEGHLESARGRRKISLPKAQPGRKSIVVTLKIPAQWEEVGRKAFPGGLSQAIKAASQLRLESETGVLLPVQNRMGEWLGRDE